MDTSPNRQTALLDTLEGLAPHHHACSIYETTDERFAVAVPFIRIGLDRGERVIYVADDGMEPPVQDALHAGGIDVERAVATGSLVFETSRSTHLKHGTFDPDWMLSYWTDVTAQAMQDGYSALRGIGENGWLRGAEPSLQRWIEFESRLSRVVADLNWTGLCQYPRYAFSPEIILAIIRTHPLLIYRGVVSRNMYYVPPEEFLGGNQAAVEVDRLLANIHDREEVERTLRRQRDELQASVTERNRAQGELQQSEGLLRLVLDAIPVGVAVTDRAGDIVLTNPASRRIWGGLVTRSAPERYAQCRGWWHDTGERLAMHDWGSVRALTTGETSVDEVIDIEAFDGIRKTILNSAAPIRDETGGIAGTVIVNEDISDRTAAERKLTDSYAQMRALTGKLMKAQDDERRRIAQMLHETTAQDLAALKMHLARWNRTKRTLTKTDRSTLTECIQLAEQSMREVRTLSYLLHPPFLDDSGLTSALRWYAAGFTARSGILVDLELPAAYARPSLDVETALFRIVQEALINIYTHSGSATASIRLARHADALVLEIVDRGRGIPKEALVRILRGEGVVGVGIAGMAERVEQLGGRLEITSSDEGAPGTTVRVRLPSSAEPRTAP